MATQEEREQALKSLIDKMIDDSLTSIDLYTDEAKGMFRDTLAYGYSVMLDGKRVPLEDVFK